MAAAESAEAQSEPVVPEGHKSVTAPKNKISFAILEGSR